MFRNLLLCASLFSISALFGASNTFDTEYAGGTIVTIPVKAKGQLDLSDTTDLQFRYGKPTYKLPYSQITSIEVSNSSNDAWTGKVTKHLPFMKKKQLVTIGFKGNDGRSETIQLEIAQNTVTNALPALESRSGRKAASPQFANGGAEVASSSKASTPTDAAAQANYDPWWGDRYWKTNRNIAVWEKDKK